MNLKQIQPFDANVLGLNEINKNRISPASRISNHLLNCQKLKSFKIKNSSAKAFSKKNNHFHQDLGLVRKFTLPETKTVKENKSSVIHSDQKSNKFVCLSGKKIGLKQDENGVYRVALFKE